MGFPDYESYDALGLAELVARGEVQPSELLDAALARVEARNAGLGAVVLSMADEARAAIAAGLPEGPFRGVPFLLKDLHVLAAGVPTTHGCRLFEGFVPDHDSELVARYRRAGLVIFGKTHSSELGLAPSSESRLYGKTHNPWNREHSAGGSSGGAAAAVAAGLVPLAHASDGGGSIRIPAACCGVFGLKPTRARNPAGPDLGEGWSGMSTAHAVSRSVRDCAALLDASAGAAPGDPYWAPPPARSFLAEVGAPPGRLRIAVQGRAFNGVETHPDCKTALEDAARLCAELGHQVEEAELEVEREALADATRVVVAANSRVTLEDRAAALGRPLAAEDVEPVTWALLALGATAGAGDYARAIRVLHATGRRVSGFLERYDALLTPTLATPPPRLGHLDLSNPDPRDYLAHLMDAIGFTQLFNASGHPAIAVPLFWSDAGLPIGVQFAGRFGDEATLLRLAGQLEAARPWAGRRPAS